jgi:hypothetical protein
MPVTSGNNNITIKIVLINLLLLSLAPICCRAKTFEYGLIQSNNLQRQELLQQKCVKYYLDSNELYQNNSIHTLSDVEMEHLLIDRQHKFLYCYVPKVRLQGSIIECFILLLFFFAPKSSDIIVTRDPKKNIYIEANSQSIFVVIHSV